MQYKELREVISLANKAGLAEIQPFIDRHISQLNNLNKNNEFLFSIVGKIKKLQFEGIITTPLNRSAITPFDEVCARAEQSLQAYRAKLTIAKDRVQRCDDLLQDLQTLRMGPGSDTEKLAMLVTLLDTASVSAVKDDFESDKERQLGWGFWLSYRNAGGMSRFQLTLNDIKLNALSAEADITMDKPEACKALLEQQIKQVQHLVALIAPKLNMAGFEKVRAFFHKLDDKNLGLNQFKKIMNDTNASLQDKIILLKDFREKLELLLKNRDRYSQTEETALDLFKIISAQINTVSYFAKIANVKREAPSKESVAEASVVPVETQVTAHNEDGVDRSIMVKQPLSNDRLTIDPLSKLSKEAILTDVKSQVGYGKTTPFLNAANAQNSRNSATCNNTASSPRRQRRRLGGQLSPKLGPFKIKRDLAFESLSPTETY